MTERMLCPFHAERTPSLVVYATGFKCFGCGKTGTLDALGMAAPVEVKPRYVEDVQASLERIRALPVIQHRGLEFHADETFYYVIWPDGSYYNARRFAPSEDKQKYKCPSGVARPLFGTCGGGTSLIACEGEINARSVEAAFRGTAAEGRVDICSPGSANDFYGPRFRTDLAVYRRYPHILAILDEDKAGAIGAIQFKTKLLAAGIGNVSIKLMPRDANDWLCNEGKDALRNEILKDLDLPAGVQGDQEALPAPGGSTAGDADGAGSAQD